jgi:hypothetical protein
MNHSSVYSVCSVGTSPTFVYFVCFVVKKFSTR